MIIWMPTQSLASIATTAMQGNYLGIIPRDSIFFFPETTNSRQHFVRASGNRGHFNIQKLDDGLINHSAKSRSCRSLVRFDKLQLQLFATATRNGDCYLFDANGFIFATTSPTQPVNSFIVFSALANQIIRSVQRSRTRKNFRPLLISRGSSLRLARRFLRSFSRRRS